MKTTLALFGATRYWGLEPLQSAAAQMEAAMADLADETIVAIDGAYPEGCADSDAACIIIPMSGAVQAPLVQFAQRFKRVVLFAGYVSGNFDAGLCNDMVRLNAAPTTMDSWAVLRQSHPDVSLCTDRTSLQAALAAPCKEATSSAPANAADATLPKATNRLLLIGETEPWVISSSRHFEKYARIGIEVVQCPSAALADLFTQTTDTEAAEMTAHFANRADALAEPSHADVAAAARLAVALEALIRRHEADGAAIACFNLIPVLGTTSCLAVSHINERTKFVAACEGDLDSAATLLFMKQKTDKGVWMANPNLQPDGSVNFTHCTAPLAVCGKQCAFRLRNHHESGVGVSPEVNFPTGGRVTLCRISADHGQMTVQNGYSETGAREASCRTQLRIRPDDFGHYIQTSLGCHQVIAFEDIAEDMKALGRKLGLKVI